MAEIHVAQALLEDGWRRDVLITLDGRTITAVTPDAAPTTNVLRFSGIAVPGVANVHSHAFQRAMAGLVERRGPEDDSFWTWREVMYRFLATMTPDDIEAVDASLIAARDLVGRVRTHIETEAHASRVPAGAPPRTAPDYSALSPEQKIRLGLQQRAS